MRRIGAVVLIALALLVSSLSLTSAQAGSRDTLRLVAITQQDAWIDLGKRGPSLGDLEVFNDKLRHRGGGPAGELNGQCTVTQKHRRTLEAQCLVTASLSGGDVTVQGVVSFQRRRANLAVTGGTGDHDDASGQVFVRFVSEKRAHLRVELND